MKTVFRWIVRIALVLLAALLVLHIFNYRRIDAGGFKAGVDALVARSEHLKKLARPEYQDHVLAGLAPNRHNGPFYRFDEHLSEARVIAAPKVQAGGDEGVLYRLEFDNPRGSGLFAPQKDARQALDGGLLKCTGASDRAYLSNEAPITVRREDVGDIIIRARAHAQTRLTLAWSREYPPERNPFHYSIDMLLEKSDELRTYVINARDALKYGLGPTDAVAHIYLRPSSIPGVEVDIDFIRFTSKQSLYLAAANGALYETLGSEVRPVLYMLSDQHLAWRVAVPKEMPRLTFGQGLLPASQPGRFAVTVSDGGKSTTIHDAATAEGGKWQDHAVDLAPWAGKTVEIGLHVSATQPKTVMLWSNPMVRSRPADRFNVIVILEDALRADYLSAYGYGRDTSPNKKRLMAERGVLFEHAFSQAEKTRPSVPALMTGLYPTATDVWHFSDMLSERYLTLAEILRSQGFATASFIQNGNAGPAAGLHQGFEIVRDEKLTEGSAETVLAGHTFDWLAAHRDENFFLYLHVIDPHGAYEPPPPFDAWYLEDKGKGRRLKPDYRHHDPKGMTSVTDVERRARYAGEIKHNDSLMPALFDRLRSLGLAEDTLVVFLSDHGEFMGENGRWEHHPPTLTPGVRVPLMMVYPKRFAKPERVRENVQLIDVMPTILELAGIERGDLMLQGDSLVDLIEGRNKAYWDDRVVVTEEPTAMLREAPCACASFFRRDWHLVASSWMWRGRALRREIPQTMQGLIQMRAYNFHDDPREEGIEWSFLPDIYLRWLQYDSATRLREAGSAIHDGLTANEKAATRLDPQTLQHLRGLGYVN